jgi:hypothetical protein
MKTFKYSVCSAMVIALLSVPAFSKSGTISTTKTGTISTTRTGTISTTATGSPTGRLGTISTTRATQPDPLTIDTARVLEMLVSLFYLR